ncbi:nucleolar and spindle-associated protein 1 [Takifugu rubripes]|uniref:nucleolar and spindle-associated protein 1 n=1 Tax=Takifugu rubripes TaxID=31033 RepID=UPI0011457E27|nr:nucleolar and spindle-associated protein 1 [Takifugu rubripes]
MKSVQQASNMDFDSMKYAELRSLAKELGLKANKKANELLEAIKQHYQQEAEESQLQEKEAADVLEDENASSAQKSTETSSKEEIFNPPVFVNTRRGKANGTKRKISDTSMANECNVHGPPASAEVGTEEAVSAASCGARRGKKRRVSSAKDPETVSTGSHHQPEIGDELAVIADTAPEKESKIAKAGKIPRLQKKMGTPNFKKLHEAHFNKMESIDSYFQRKTKNLETYRGSAKDSKKPSEKTKPQQPKCQERATRASLISPAPNRRAAEEKRRNTMLSATKAPPKPAGKEDAAFRPSVLSIRRINVRFTEATHDNGSKRSMVKTPARMSSCVASSTPADKGKANSVKTAVLSATKTPGPFVFTGNTSNITTPGAQKPKFDLKASLSRPLTYKPHAGKLKPFGDVKENTTANKSLVSVSSHQKNYKQHQTKTREDRRAKQMQDRKQKKESALGARRGLAMM